MPSGFTAPVRDGTITSFREFALLCARGCGVGIALRDEPWGPLPPQLPRHDYHANALVEARKTLAELQGRTAEDWAAAVATRNEAATRAYEEAVVKNTETLKRYEEMLAAVLAWEPPTPEHVPFRSFMIKQLNESIEWDCHPPTPLRYTRLKSGT